MELNVLEQYERGNYTTTGTKPAAKKSKTALDSLLGVNESISTSANYKFNTAKYSFLVQQNKCYFVPKYARLQLLPYSIQYLAKVLHFNASLLKNILLSQANTKDTDTIIHHNHHYIIHTLQKMTPS